MSSVRGVPARDDVRTHWKWAIGLCAAVALMFAMCAVFWPRHDRATDICVGCASRRESSHTSTMFGVFRWGDASTIVDSSLVTDRLVPPSHQHEWVTLTAVSDSLSFHSIACGDPRTRPFAWWYATDAEFRRAVSDRISAGTLTLEQVGRAMARPEPDSPYGARPPIEELLAQFAPK